MFFNLFMQSLRGEGEMGQQGQEPMVQVLHAIVNPIRMAAIEALSQGEMRFSQLLASCDLDYDHDTGYFYYHISELMNGRIIVKAGNAYRLTAFGRKIAGIINSLERECSSLLVERTEGGEGNMVIQNLEKEWIDTSDFVNIEFENGKGEDKFQAKISSLEESTRAGIQVKKIALDKPSVDELPEGPRKRKMARFIEEVKSWKGTKTMLIKDKDTIVGWATVINRMSWMGKWTGESAEEKPQLELSPKAFLVIEDVGIPPWAEDRKGMATSLFKALLEKAQEMGADAIELMRVDVGDSAVLEALSDLGFEKMATSHSMKKTLKV
jgi:hypothetical protein